jgi:hypothetical protein
VLRLLEQARIDRARLHQDVFAETIDENAPWRMVTEAKPERRAIG